MTAILSEHRLIARKLFNTKDTNGKKICAELRAFSKGIPKMFC